MDVSSRMRLSGRMAIRAFLHPRATVGEAIEAVKEDLVSFTVTLSIKLPALRLPETSSQRTLYSYSGDLKSKIVWYSNGPK